MSRTPHRLLRGALLLGLALPGLLRPAPALAQQVAWNNLATFYADNTEFFTPFRTGETLLGAQFQSWLGVGLSRRTSLRAGVFGDLRYGDQDFLTDVKPVIAFRYETPTTLGVLGTLETVDRHGYLEPLEVTTLEFTRPLEYGGQLMQRHRRWDLDVFLDWQRLNTPNQREVFNYGAVARVRPFRPLTIEGQFHGLHHGGQLFAAGVPVTNNTVAAVGARLADSLPVLGRSAAAWFHLTSKGFITPDQGDSLPTRGHGDYLRLSVTPGGWFELFGIYWFGRDFHTDEGDPNYNSLGADGSFYRSRRRYAEIGVVRRAMIDDVVGLDAEFRLHRIDHERSQALFDSRWEYSYRLVLRAPFTVILRR